MRAPGRLRSIAYRVSARQPGDATLTVTAGGFSQDFPVSVVSALDAPQEIIPEPESIPTMAGERGDTEFSRTEL